MAVTATPYGNFIMGMGSGLFNLGTSPLKIMLTTSVYLPNQDNHVFVSDVTNEVTGTGYVAGGQALTGVTWVYDSTNKRGQLNADTVVWTGATFTAHYGVIYQDGGTPAASRLVGWIDFGMDKSPASEDFQVTSPSGVLRLRAV